MRILIIHEIDWFKKIIFEPHHFAELLSLQGHEVYVIDCQEPNIKNLTKGFHTVIIPKSNRYYDNATVTVIRPPSLLIKGLNRLSNFLTCESVIRKIASEKKIDLILLYGVATNGIQTIKVSKELNIPVIFRVLDVAHGLVSIPILRQLVKKYEKIVLSQSAKVFAPTNELRNYAIEMGAKADKIKIFPLGINLTDFKPMKKDFKLAKSIGICEDDKVIVFVGTIYDFAGLDTIISKFDFLSKKIEKIKFLIVGGGPFLKQLQTMVRKKRKESQIIFTGFVPQKEIPKYISISDLCVNPFRINYVTERILPIKILEYLACGKPVISTPLKGAKEFLPNENFGIIYSDFNDFVTTLSNFLNDEKKLFEMGQHGYSYVKKYHDWEVLSKKLIQEFSELISEKNN